MTDSSVMSSVTTRTLVYNFDTVPRKGFGARLHDILNCLVYCRANNVEFALIRDQSFNYFGHTWNEIFQWASKYRTVSRSDLDGNANLRQWPNFESNWGAFGKTHSQYRKFFSTSFYSKMMQELFQLQPEMQARIDEWVQKSGFVDTDWVIHVRWSDKVNQVSDKATVVESGAQDLWWYWKPVADRWKRSANSPERDTVRVFLCSDSSEPLDLLPTPAPFPIVWDKNEDRSGNYCPKTYRNELSESEQRAELYTALKNLQIIKNCSWLCGARCSYFFRIGELLRFPKHTENVKDNDMFGIAEYESRPGIQQVRPQKTKCFLNFLERTISSRTETHRRELLETGITTIPNIIDPVLAEILSYEIQNLPNSVFKVALRYSGSEAPFNFSLDQTEEIKKYTALARESLNAGHFSYSFKRMFVDPHPDSCICVGCRFNHTLESYECLDLFNTLTGLKLTKIKETFLSVYQKHDWLSVHHDHKKGKIAFVFNFTKNWNVAHGGLLHFVDNWNKPNQSIYKTVLPEFNSVTLFILDESKPNKNHFVSEVVGNRNRLAFTGWME